MLQRAGSRRLALVAIFAAVTGCAPVAPAGLPTADAVQSQAASAAIAAVTLAPTITQTATPSATPSASPTASATSSPTATPTLTHTASATPTETATATETATRTPLPPPTFTATPRPEAPRFAESSYVPFDAPSFRRELQELVKFQSDFLVYFRRVAAGEFMGGCRSFYSYRNELIVSQEAYYDVPDNWFGIYFRYRTITHAAVENVAPITQVCDSGGGDVPPEADQVIIENLERHIAQAQQLINEAAAIP